MTRLLQSYPRLLGFAGLCAIPAAATGFAPWAIGVGVVAHGLTVAHGVAGVRSSLLVPTCWHGDRSRAAVALTFDDGPHPASTPTILATLARHGARATFFMIGRWAERHPELTRAVLAGGHQIGNHTRTHPRTLNLRSGRAIAAEIEAGERALREVLESGVVTEVEPGLPAVSSPAGSKPATRPGVGTESDTPLRFRPPVGLRSPMLMTALRSFPRPLVTWSVHSHDRTAESPEAIATRVLRRIAPGDIVVLHDGNDRDGSAPRHTAAAVPLILDGLRTRGLLAVTLDALLA